jgi:hypothetical protein
MGNLIAHMKAEFPISCSFVVLPEHRQWVLTWLEKAVGPYTVEELPDGQIAVALGDRYDATQLREHHRYYLDHSVIVVNRSPEQVREFISETKGWLTS